MVPTIIIDISEAKTKPKKTYFSILVELPTFIELHIYGDTKYYFWLSIDIR